MIAETRSHIFRRRFRCRRRRLCLSSLIVKANKATANLTPSFFLRRKSPMNEIEKRWSTLDPVFIQILLLFRNTNIPADHVIENSYQDKIVITSFAGSKLDQDSFAISLSF